MIKKKSKHISFGTSRDQVFIYEIRYRRETIGALALAFEAHDIFTKVEHRIITFPDEFIKNGDTPDALMENLRNLEANFP